MVDIEDISQWDLVRFRMMNKPVEEVFLEFANITSKKFMDDKPERWYRFCDGNYTETDFHLEWLQLILENPRIAIESAREHHKTSFMLNWILFNMVRNDNFSVLYLSSTHGQAKDKVAEWAEIYESNQDWLGVEKAERNWSKTKKKLSNGSVIRGQAFGTALEGAHVQLIVMDDILQEEGTGAMLDSEIWQYYSRVVSPMSTETGKIILVGTKKRQGDIFDKVDSNPEWVHEVYPSTPKDPIFPEKWPKERLEAQKREMMARNFNREFGLEVIIEDDVLMPPSWNDRNRDDSLSYPRDGWKKGLNVCGLDPAISPTGDHAAFFSISRNADGERFVIDVTRKRGMSLNDMLIKLQSLDARYNYQSIVIEKNAFQSLVVNEAIETTSLPVSGHETTRQKSHPSEGIPRIAVHFENGKYVYPYKEYEDIEDTDMVFDALNSIKYDEGKIKNNHTPDIVMAKYMCENALRKFEQDDNVVDEPIISGVKGGI